MKHTTNSKKLTSQDGDKSTVAAGRIKARPAVGKSRAVRPNRTTIEAEQRRYLELFQFAPDGYIITDPEGVIYEANAAAAAMLGAPPEALVGDKLSAHLAEEQRPNFLALMEQLQQVGHAQTWELWLQTREDTLLPISVTAVATNDSEGEPTSLRWILRDIRGRLAAEEALRESEERFRTLAEVGSVGLIIGDEDGRVSYMNPMLLATLGYTEEQVKSGQVRLPALTPPEYAAQDTRATGQLRSTGRAIPYEKEFITSDGRRIPVYVGMSVLRRRNGNILEVATLVTDLAPLKEAEHALREAQELNTAILDTTGALIVVLDLDGRIVRFNPACEAATGYSQGEASGKLLWELLIAPEEIEGVQRIFQQLSLERLPNRHENDWVARDGRRRHIAWSNTALLDRQGNPQYIVSSGLDITEHKAVEEERLVLLRQLRELNETLEQRVVERTTQLRALAIELSRAEERERRRLAQVLHDHLQQLLVAARLRVNLGQHQSTDDQISGLLQQVDELLSQSIQVSRSLTVELSPPVLHTFGLPAALRWLAQWMQEKYGLVVDVQAAEDADPLDEDIRAKLFQIVRELLFNVAKHAQVSQAAVRLNHPAEDLVELIVYDAGVGFDPTGIGQPAEGGFGLFNIREQLELLGGRADVDSAPGQGTRVALRIPLRDCTSYNDCLPSTS